MIRLSLLRGPVPVDLSDLVPGVKLILRRLNSMEMNEAAEAAASTIKRLRESGEALAAYGLDGPDANGKSVDLSDPPLMLRIGYLIGAVEVAIRAIDRWEGICLEDGSPASVDRKSLSVLMMDDAICRRVLEEISKSARILVAEKKDCGASPNGSSVEEPTASAPNTATIAVKPDAPAPAANGEETENIALK